MHRLIRGDLLLAKMSPKTARRLLWQAAALLVLIAASFVWLYRDVRLGTSESVPARVHRRMVQFSQRMDNFLDPLVDDLRALRQMGRQGVLPMDQPGQCAAVIVPILQKPSLALNGFVLADTEGRELKWIKQDGRWQQVSSPYDIRTRPWFQDALKITDPNQVLSSGVYTFHTRQKPGVTMCAPYSVSGRQERYVIAFDVALSDFVQFLTSLDIEPQVRLFLLQDRRVADLTHYATLLHEQATEENFWKDLSEHDEVLTASVAAWIKQGARSGEPSSFTAAKEKWWAEFENRQSQESDLHLALLIPEQVLSTPVRRTILWVSGLAGGTLGVLVVYLGFVLYRQSRILHAAPRHAGLVDSDADALLQAIQEGESAQLEFKSTLRWNVRANKPGKEIEIACMKTMAAFLNSEGGVLLVGVEDDGNILGIESDNFPNDDKFLLHFNNLIKQHLGLECAPFIAFALKRVGDKGVLVVDCVQATAPVFVKQNNREDFYVRIGPGTRELATSEALSYIQSHFETAT
ncbi:MAG: RNA-binding domain-containing protein [Planctomycetota bacterium]